VTDTQQHLHSPPVALIAGLLVLACSLACGVGDVSGPGGVLAPALSDDDLIPDSVQHHLLGMSKDEVVALLGSPDDSESAPSPKTIDNAGVAIEVAALYRWGQGLVQAGPLNKPIANHDAIYVMFDGSGRAVGVKAAYGGELIRIRPSGYDELGFLRQGGQDYRATALPGTLLSLPAAIDAVYSVPPDQWGLRVQVRERGGMVEYPATLEPVSFTVRWDLQEHHVLAVVHPLWVQGFDTTEDRKTWGWGQTLADWGVSAIFVAAHTGSSTSGPLVPLSALEHSTLVTEEEFGRIVSRSDTRRGNGEMQDLGDGAGAPSRPSTKPPMEVDADAEREVRWWEEQEAAAAALSRDHPSEIRDSIRREFDMAPRDPVGGDTTLADLYAVLRDVDKCDPAAAGYSLSADSLRVLRNTPFALRGYSFSSPELERVFRQEPWYEALPSVNGSNPPLLDPVDKTCVRKLKKLEAR
jgi:hypothetical protein